MVLKNVTWHRLFEIAGKICPVTQTSEEQIMSKDKLRSVNMYIIIIQHIFMPDGGCFVNYPSNIFCNIYAFL